MTPFRVNWDALKKCPICLNKPKVTSGADHFVFISCVCVGKDGTSMETFSHVKDAVETWNARVDAEVEVKVPY